MADGGAQLPYPGCPVSRRTFLLAGLASAAAAGCAKTARSPIAAGTQLKVARPDSPVTWPIAQDNQPILGGLTPEKNATLRLYNYADYIDPAALRSFERKYRAQGVKVSVSTFNDSTEALAKLRSGRVQFDIYFPSYDQIGKLVSGGLIRPLNHAYLPNIRQVWPEFQNPFYDQEWRYSVPYTIYTTGIGWRTDKVKEDVGALPNPYDVFWDSAYRGRLSVLDDYRSVMDMVLLRNKIYDINTADPKNLALVKTQLLELAKATRPRTTISDYIELPEGRTSLVQAWSGDMVNAVSYLPKGVSPGILRYWFPADGRGEVNNDLMVVLRSSRNPVLAHLFLNHMLDYPVAIGNFGAIGYQPPQTRITPEKLVADGFLPKNLASATVLPSQFKTGFRTYELEPANDAAWQNIWRQFKAGG